MSAAAPTGACDVAIVGGGPAGSATALSLAARAPQLAVVLIEATRYTAPRLGETLPPPARRLLEHLGVWEAFARAGGSEHAVQREVWGTSSSWGAAQPRDDDFVFGRGGAGWHLDRAGFDDLLASAAEARGVRLLRGTRLRAAERSSGGGWRLRLASGDSRSEPAGATLAARLVVDATGSAAAFARRRGARLVAADRLVGFARFFADDGAGDPRTRVEAVADGWWYTAGLPGGRRVAACLTDADLGRRLGLADAAVWSRHLAATMVMRQALAAARPLGPVTVHAAASRRLDPAAGDGWLAVGDAASTFDPLSSAGILKALRSGIFASYAAADLLTRGDPTALARHRRYVDDEFAGYARVRERHYDGERRWPEGEFWRRRQKVNPGDALGLPRPDPSLRSG